MKPVVDRDEAISRLSCTGWLERADPGFRDAFLAPSRLVALAPGEPMTFAGDAEADLFGVVSGTATAVVGLAAPHTRIMHIARSGFWFGYGPLISGLPARTSARARTSMQALRIPFRAAQTILTENPAWWKELGALSLLYGDITASIAADLLIPSGLHRCAATIVRYGDLRARYRHDDQPVTLDVTHEELGHGANLTRNPMGLALGRLAALGLIEKGYREIVVPRPSDLVRFVDEME